MTSICLEGILQEVAGIFCNEKLEKYILKGKLT